MLPVDRFICLLGSDSEWSSIVPYVDLNCSMDGSIAIHNPIDFLAVPLHIEAFHRNKTKTSEQASASLRFANAQVAALTAQMEARRKAAG